MSAVEEEIGVVTDYLNRAGVAVVRLTDGDLSLGDRVKITGPVGRRNSPRRWSPFRSSTGVGARVARDRGRHESAGAVAQLPQHLSLLRLILGVLIAGAQRRQFLPANPTPPELSSSDLRHGSC